MNFSRRRIGCAAALGGIAALVIGWLTLYSLSGVSDAIALKGPIMEGLRKEWLLDGSPEDPPIKRYTQNWTDPDRFFVWTNHYSMEGRLFECLFGMNDPKFEGKGILVISKGGELIWVDSRKTPRLLAPNQ
jgi:hypothetical protein